MNLVSNAGPLLSFARAGELDLLQSVVQSVLIPEAVRDEVFTRSGGLPFSAQPPWIAVRAVVDPNLPERLPNKLHRGEREAIVLARELNGTLLIDDKAARREAQRLVIPHFGSLRVLAEAKTRDLIPRVQPLLDRLIATGTYISDALYQEFLRQVDEA